MCWCEAFLPPRLASGSRPGAKAKGSLFSSPLLSFFFFLSLLFLVVCVSVFVVAAFSVFFCFCYCCCCLSPSLSLCFSFIVFVFAVFCCLWLLLLLLPFFQLSLSLSLCPSLSALFFFFFFDCLLLVDLMLCVCECTCLCVCTCICVGKDSGIYTYIYPSIFSHSISSFFYRFPPTRARHTHHQAEDGDTTDHHADPSTSELPAAIRLHQQHPPTKTAYVTNCEDTNCVINC